MSSDLPVSLTVGVLAKRLGIPIHRVEHLIRSRNIKPTSRAGNSRVFSESDLTKLASIVQRIDTGKAALRHG
jgi:DNA-binding transcriptional MerR regulator